MTDTLAPGDAPEARTTGATSPQPNLPELKRLNMWVQEQDKIEPGARIWHQGKWVSLREETPMCQTAYCVAGMTLIRAGHELGINQGDMWLDGREASSWDVQALAQRILGINIYTGDRLFEATNDAGQVDRLIHLIFDVAGADYDSVEPAPDLEIEIKAAEAVRPQLLPSLTNA